jgi:hypothetical protein
MQNNDSGVGMAHVGTHGSLENLSEMAGFQAA